jgi:uncharacterized protein (TIGR03437 family)
MYGQALYRKPVKVIGDPQYTGTASNPLQFTNNGPNWVEGREFSFPSGIAVDNSVSPPNVYISDFGNHRVLAFSYTTQLKAGAKADLVLGQIDFYANLPQGPSGRATGMNSPSGLTVDSAGNLYVADTGNNRILRYPSPFAQPAGALQFPNMVIGQTTFSGKSANQGGTLSATTLSLNNGSISHAGLAFDPQGNLWVTDTGNNRVLRYPASVLKAGTNGPAADVVVGQPDFVTHAGVLTLFSKTGLAGPQGVAFDSAGRLLVTDSGGRLMVYPAGAGTNAVATRIAGIDPNSASRLSQSSLSAGAQGGPFGVSATATSIVVADTFNNRLMVYPPVDAWPPETTQFSPNASNVVGQIGYTTNKANQGNAEPSANTLNTPVDVAASGSELFAVDAVNNRVLVYPATTAGVSTTAVRVIGQLDFPYDSPNLIEGKEFNLAAFLNASSPLGTAVLDQSVSPPRLYVADTWNHRILGFKDFTHLQNGQTADVVIGQPDLFRSVANYPSNDATTPNQQGLRFPTGLAVDSAGNLFVADTGNSRILRFPAPFASGKTALESADLVLGQIDFTSIVTDASDHTMNSPTGIALTQDALNPASSSGWLIAADATHNRVLFFAKPFTNGESATKLLGALNYNVVTAGSPDAARFNSPHGVAVDANDRVFVVDTGNHRVQVFNKASVINNFDTPPTSLVAFSTPVTVTPGSNGFWVSDFSAGSAIHFPPADQLPIKNNASDASISIAEPLSVFSDSFGNLLVADALQRISYYAPQLDVVSAANYSTKPVTPGQIAAIFPRPSTNVISGGNDSFTTLPLPTTLADTQAVINGSPIPLFFASNGQLNVQIPSGLSTGGTVDLQVIRPSTGQIFGGVELQLATASPAFFTANATGSGQIAAINVSDGTVNGPLSPVLRGQLISLYGTGLGPVAGAPPDGNAATSTVPGPVPQVLIGASATSFLDPANIQYSGLAPTLVGVWQLNLQIPNTAPTGSSVPIKVFLNSISNVDGNGASTATIAIK